MSALDEIFDGIDEEWEVIEGATVDAARAELAALRARVAELEATVALNKYVVPPFELTDDATVQLALECVKKDERIAQLEATVAHYTAKETSNE